MYCYCCNYCNLDIVLYGKASQKLPVACFFLPQLMSFVPSFSTSMRILTSCMSPSMTLNMGRPTLPCLLNILHSAICSGGGEWAAKAKPSSLGCSSWSTFGAGVSITNLSTSTTQVPSNGLRPYIISTNVVDSGACPLIAHTAVDSVLWQGHSAILCDTSFPDGNGCLSLFSKRIWMLIEDLRRCPV